MALITNRVASQALRGQDIVVTMNGDDAITYIDTLEVGQACTLASSSKTGLISFVDYPGHIFKITPIQPDKSLDSSSTPGYLAVNEGVSVLIV